MRLGPPALLVIDCKALSILRYERSGPRDIRLTHRCILDDLLVSPAEVEMLRATPPARLAIGADQ